ncbi:MAG: DUF5518 domain-containing protein [Methanobacteriaceae archaeon]|nr:DUF5518 domain-containing protein [Methanobacteriaceae archaeon]MDP2837019.1 DUF5518 domain-containing protein [Methanobacteriaceae archaeon]MDP3034809.1 DUF5518 domain-containing protein [Methanobacteriaceae archaeon]MDP3485789.1 DUF5518 domain-containing protein [Methanobacteriaceae archaeon]MDP3624432.1 DUF5518 domain-containing protein [Methanobacteriaceae archaeon]
MDWKTIGIGALVNAALTIFLSWIFLPLFFLGPIAGGFITSYLSKGFEDYEVMDEKDGAVVGTMSGIIGGILIGLLLILGLGNMDAINGFISTGIGLIVTAYIIIQLSVIVSLVLGLIGGILGVVVKK